MNTVPHSSNIIPLLNQWHLSELDCWFSHGCLGVGVAQVWSKIIPAGGMQTSPPLQFHSWQQCPGLLSENTGLASRFSGILLGMVPTPSTSWSCWFPASSIYLQNPIQESPLETPLWHLPWINQVPLDRIIITIIIIIIVHIPALIQWHSYFLTPCGRPINTCWIEFGLSLMGPEGGRLWKCCFRNSHGILKAWNE